MERQAVLTFSTRQVDEEMDAVFDQLSTAVEAFRSIAADAARAESAWKSAYARALLDAKVPGLKRTAAEVEALATVATETPFLAYKLSAAQERAQRELLGSLRARLDGLRTVCANLRVMA